MKNAKSNTPNYLWKTNHLYTTKIGITLQCWLYFIWKNIFQLIVQMLHRRYRVQKTHWTRWNNISSQQKHIYANNTFHRKNVISSERWNPLQKQLSNEKEKFTWESLIIHKIHSASIKRNSYLSQENILEDVKTTPKTQQT